MADIPGAYVRRQEMVATEAELATYGDKILMYNEMLYVRMNNGTIRAKLGDGVTPVKNLAFTKVFDGSVVQSTGESETSVMSQKAVSDQLYYVDEKIDKFSEMMVLGGDGEYVESRYHGRETANGIAILDGGSTVLKRIWGDTVAASGILQSSTIEKITSKGRNLLAKTYVTETNNGITFSVKPDGSVSPSGTATGKAYLMLGQYNAKTLPKGTYCVSGGNVAVSILVEGYNGYTWAKQLINRNGAFEVDYSSYDRVLIRLYVYTGITPSGTIFPMMNIGGLAYPWEEYKEDSLVFPQKVRLEKYDYIDFTTKKIIRKSFTRVFTGDDPWSEVYSSDGSNLRFGITMALGAVGYTGVCSHYEMGKGLADYLQAGSGAVLYNDAQKNFQVVDKAYTSLADFQAHLRELYAAGTPMTITYEIQSETEEALPFSDFSYTAFQNGMELIEGNDASMYGANCCVRQFYLLAHADKNGHSNNTRFPVLTFIDDDGSNEAFRNWEMIGDAAGITNTFAVPTGRSDIDWDMVERMQGKGYEFISHTHSHIALNTASTEEIEEDLAQSVATLREHGCQSKYIVYPNNWAGAGEATVRKYFTAGVLGGDVINYPPLDPFAIKRHNVLTGNRDEATSEILFKSLDDFKALIDEAVKYNGWLIFMSHCYTNTNGYHCGQAERDLLVQVCKYAAKMGMKILPFGKAYEMYANRLTSGKITDESYCIVDCDGVTYEK